jgi:hypothetical protein
MLSNSPSTTSTNNSISQNTSVSNATHSSNEIQKNGSPATTKEVQLHIPQHSNSCPTQQASTRDPYSPRSRSQGQEARGRVQQNGAWPSRSQENARSITLSSPGVGNTSRKETFGAEIGCSQYLRSF